MRAQHGSVASLVLKIGFLAVVDAFALLALQALLAQGSHIVFAIVLGVTVVVNWIYLKPGLLPAKYLAPGLIFLGVFQVFVVIFSGYIAFTNYGDGHNGSKDQAIDIIQRTSLVRVPDSASYQVAVLERDGQLSLLLTQDGEALWGDAQTPLVATQGATFDGGKAVALPGFTTLSFADMLSRQQEIVDLKVALSEDPGDGAIATQDGTNAFLFASSLEFDPETGDFVDLITGTRYSDTGTGAFVSVDGKELTPGWKIDVGFANFAKAFTDPSIRGPLLGVTAWTFAFAGLSVLLTFAMGLALALLFNDPRMKGVRFYRIMVILPYAFPGFLSGLVWLGLLNQDFGFVNQVIFGGAAIPWLTDPWLARLSVIVVNLWLGFPYMFLISTGALQAIPQDIIEAARVDGARPWQVLRLIKLPLLLVAVAPMLISSFAFNFNNFNIIYMLTGGGPRSVTAGVDAGATDLLITLVYKVAFGSGTGRDYGLASAFAILIFVVVATVSLISFKRTKTLEEIN